MWPIQQKILQDDQLKFVWNTYLSNLRAFRVSAISASDKAFPRNGLGYSIGYIFRADILECTKSSEVSN